MIPLLILGLLKERPESYGYELLADMEANYFQYFVRFTKGSFYYNMQQLEEKGMIEKVVTNTNLEEKGKNRYFLTELGEREFERLFLKYGSKSEPITFPFYTPMVFVDQVEPEVMKEILAKQIDQTKEKIQLIDDALKTPNSLRRNFVKMMENSKHHHEVNLAWFQEQLNEYNN
ncbi:PadR family transcriptional regulator [Enterococcus pseudoavium]|uniref:PadR family transcriptional regulator n=1 Tax=Enterococcus pseudoavium TaxID=44007 RepID=A0ABU3FJ34_9ENTE|nr:PadR family transcriptional regulator [Enterococcus pseudoavium]MDT2771072.1 PadR family transcriptional regulator [Enterococcus pseudoavium]